MKKNLTLVITSMFILGLIGFVFAAAETDDTGPMHDDIIAAGGQGIGSQADSLGDGIGGVNQGEGTETQEKVQLREGNYSGEGGEQIQVQEKANNQIELQVGNSKAQTALKLNSMQVDGTAKFDVTLSNGRNAEIKVMPDAASEKALEQLKLGACSEDNDCSIELKEVGSGEDVKAAYEIKVQKQSKVLGLFGVKMNVQAQVDAETGEVIQSKKPWWAFLASESEE